MSRTLLISALFIAVLVPQAGAQRVVVPGDTIRIARTKPFWLVEGELDSFSVDSVVVVRRGGGRTALALSEARVVELRRGRQVRIGRGLLLGGGIGAMLALVFDGACDGYCQTSPARGAVLGGMVGLFVIALNPAPRWIPAILRRPELPASRAGGGVTTMIGPGTQGGSAAGRPLPLLGLGVESTVLVGVRLRR
ncbi:MAG: hypothetical protein SGI84_07535 [Gemmatimonadota bacterium]|nr:hypothetical protein [Gemmatimonadota bacterium]